MCRDAFIRHIKYSDIHLTVAALVVVPRDELDEVVVEGNAGLSVEE